MSIDWKQRVNQQKSRLGYKEVDSSHISDPMVSNIGIVETLLIIIVKMCNFERIQ